MPSVIGLLEEKERDASRRVEVLRQEADRVLAELREAELSWERFVIAREAVVEVLAAPAGEEQAAASSAGDPEPTSAPAPAGGAVAGSVVPVWCDGLVASVLAPDYQRILAVLAGSGEALSCKELATGLGVKPVPAKVEGVRSKANRLVGRGWLLKEPSGRFALAPGLRGGGS
jgi:hypothetical protein